LADRVSTADAGVRVLQNAAMSNAPLHPHEAAFIQAFLIRERRERAAASLADPQKRTLFTNRLAHTLLRDLDERCVRAGPDDRFASLRPTSKVHVIATEEEFDRRSATVADIPQLLRDAQFGVVISVIPGKLAVYKGEAPADTVWLSRP
jgi:hypothetical protein